MPKEKVKTRFNYKTGRCEYENAIYITLKKGEKKLLSISGLCQYG